MSAPSVYRIKPAFQNVLRPFTARLASGGVSANQVTVAGLAVAAISGVFVAALGAGPWLLIVPLCYLVRMALNAIDGVLARDHAVPTVTGRILNEVCDVAGDAAAYLPFVFLMPDPGHAGLLMAVVVLGIATEIVALVAAADGTRANDGPFGKSDRAVAFGALALTAWLVPAGVGVGLVAMTVLAMLTLVNRTRTANVP